MDIVKLMYDLLLSGEGFSVIGTKNGTEKSKYRRTFNEDLAPPYSNIKSGINDIFKLMDEFNFMLIKLYKTIAEEYDGDEIPNEYMEPFGFLESASNKKNT